MSDEVIVDRRVILRAEFRDGRPGVSGPRARPSRTSGFQDGISYGATAQMIQLSQGVGARLLLRVLASVPGHAGQIIVDSAPSVPIPVPKQFTVAPTPKGTVAIVGTPAVGVTLAADPGVWDGAAALSYQWTQVSSGATLGTGSSLIVPAGASGSKIKLTVTATGDGYTPVSKNVTTATKVP